MEKIQKQPRIKPEEQQNAAEYLKTWSQKEESTDRTRRFFQRTQSGSISSPQPSDDFDLHKSIVLPTRHLDWNGEPIDDVKQQNKPAEFEIREILGGGGMGNVYTALQKSVDREVALKMISPDLAGDHVCRDSFLREAIVTGNLTHPNIVSVHDLGTSSDGSLFYTMQKIIGISWDKVIKNKTQEENLEILLKTCDAVAYAHNRGVIHRDLKPSNIMLGDFGEVMVADWGVAAGAGDSDLSKKAVKLTGESDIEGTPAYMSPEMLDEDCARVGPCSDIYLLGAILYEIITGRPPHKIRKDNMIHAIRFNIIQPTEHGGELVEIAYKAMATLPEERYASVKDFQQALRSYQIHRESIRLADAAEENHATAVLTGEYQLFADALFGFRQAMTLWPENQRAENGLKKLVRDYAEKSIANGDYDLALSILDPNNLKHIPLIKNIRKAKAERESRKRRITRLYLTFTGLLMVTIIGLAVAAIWVDRARTKAIAEENRAKGLLRDLEQENYYNTITLAANQLRLFNNLPAKSSLEKTLPEYRSLEWNLLNNIAQPLYKEFKGHNDSISTLAVSSDRSRLFSGSRDGVVQCRELPNGKILASYNFTTPVQSIKLAPGNNQLLIVCTDQNLNLLDLKHNTIFPVKSQNGNITAADLVAEGNQILFANQDGELLEYDLKKQQNLIRIKAHENEISAILSLKKARQAVTSGWDRAIRIWDLNNGKMLRELKGHTNYVNALAVSPDEKLIASGGGDNRLCLWNLDTGEKIMSINRFQAAVDAVSFSPDGSLLLVGYGNVVEMISLDNGKTVKSYECGKGVNVYAAIFSPDGNQVITGDGNNRIRLWDAECRMDGNPVQPSGNSTFGRLLYRDRQTGAALYSTADNRLRYQPAGETTFKELGTNEAKINYAIFTKSFDQVITGGNDTNVKIWNIKDGRLEKVLKGHKKYVSSVAITADGTRIISAGWDGKVIIWDRRSGQRLKTIDVSKEPVIYAGFAPDQHSAVTADSEGRVIVWDLRSGLEKLTLTGHTAQVNCAVFSPDGKRIISSSDDGCTKIWDVKTGQEMLSLATGSTPYNQIVVTSSGIMTIAAPGRDGKYWKINSLE